METDVLTIGEAAALFGLAPSTLRWWEKQGLVQARRRGTGRRLYGPEELRRIALVYVCRNMGLLPIAAIASVVDIEAAQTPWQGTVRGHIATLERQIRQITTARAYLTRMLGCEHDDPTRCPHLDDELRRHTPWCPERDETGGATVCRRDETPPGGSPRTGQRACPVCGTAVHAPAAGRPRTYCSNACRQRAHRARRRVSAAS